MRRSLPLAIGFLTAMTVHSSGSVIAYGWSDFYARADYGGLGIITTSDSHAANPQIKIISAESTETQKPSNQTWFVLNHLDKQATHDDMQPTYVGILVIVARSDDNAVGKARFAIHRNSGWKRDFCWRDDCFSANGTDQNFSSSTELTDCNDEIMKCVLLSRSQPNEPPFDTLVGTQFDGQVDGSPELDSWRKRDVWYQPRLIEKAGCTKPHVTCSFENILLKFVPTAGRRQMSPVKYSFDSSLAQTAVLYTYSPTETNFQNVYSISYGR